MGDGRVRHSFRHFWESEPVDQQRVALQQGYGSVPTHRDSDGVVPCRSQVWGEVISCARADHLDVVGHFGGVDRSAADADWLPTDSGFDSAMFARTWDVVAEFVTRDVTQDHGAGALNNIGRERTAFDALEADARVAASERGSDL